MVAESQPATSTATGFILAAKEALVGVLLVPPPASADRTFASDVRQRCHLWRWMGGLICGNGSATPERLNRLAKPEGRLAYGFRNPANQRRRARIACTRATPGPHVPRPQNRTYPVTATQTRPG
jgi:hypothetical protein